MAKKILSQQKNPACATLFLGNLGFETKEEEIAALFGRLHPKLAKREIEPEVNAEMDHLLRVRMGTFEDSGKCKG
jgi:RNA recognition motif-containing protein